MARYHYTRENENGVVLYLESETYDADIPF